MVTQQARGSAILYQNTDRTVFLMDIPASLALAQMTHISNDVTTVSSGVRPLSRTPPEEPYRSVEPRLGKDAEISEEQLEAEGYVCLLEYALEQIRSGRADLENPIWCEPRRAWNVEAKKRQEMRYQTIASDLSVSRSWSASNPRVLLEGSISIQCINEIQGLLICNGHSSQTRLHVNSLNADFHIPPFSNFCLSSINDATAPGLSMSALQTAASGQFDVIIIDPPWPNRSVRRSQQYQTLQYDNNPLDTIQQMLGQHIAPDGFVACWITNKDSVRETTLEMFRCWNLVLFEEWVWLKVTTAGEPVTQLDGRWRKPYERLLVGRSPPERVGHGSSLTESIERHTRRVVVAVPDLHSRKPNLKGLVEMLLIPERTEYRGLEVFARNLTAHWWAWGDEVLIYNDAQAWYQVE